MDGVVELDDAPRDCYNVTMFHFPILANWDPDKQAYVGVFIDILEIVAARMNFCYELHTEPLQTWGKRFPNGTWTGMMGQLHEKRMDFSATGFLVNAERMEDVDMSEPVIITSHTIVYRRPTLEPDIAGFIKPFTVPTWSLIGMVTVLMMLAWWVTFQSPTSRYPRGREATPPSRLEDMRRSVLMTVSVLLGQGLVSDGKKKRFNRILLCIWLLGSLLLGVVYKCNLKALLISPSIREPFHSLEQLVQEGKYPYVAVEQSFISNAIQNGEPGTLLGKMSTEIHAFLPPLVLLDNVVKGNYVGLVHDVGNVGTVQILFKTLKCATKNVDKFLMASVSFALQKDSPVTNGLNKVIVGLKEGGIIDKLMRDAAPYYTFCKNLKTMPDLRPLILEDFYGVLLLFAAGNLLAIIAFVAEVTTHAREQRRSQGE